MLEMHYGEPAAPFDGFLATAQALDIQTNPAAIRDRIRAWEKMGLLAGNARDGFTVTESAGERFGFILTPNPNPSRAQMDEAQAIRDLLG